VPPPAGLIWHVLMRVPVTCPNEGSPTPPPFRLLALEQTDSKQYRRPDRHARDKERWSSVRWEEHDARHHETHIARVGDPTLPSTGESPTPTVALCLEPRARIAHELRQSALLTAILAYPEPDARERPVVADCVYAAVTQLTEEEDDAGATCGCQPSMIPR
jgi:hypothetical protein